MDFALLLPGPLDQLTGGYLYGRQVVEGLRARGDQVRLFELPGRHPDADDEARQAASAALASLPDSHVAVIDGLALPAFSSCLTNEARRLRLVGFIHHPLSLETGLSATEVHHYAALEAKLWRQLHGVVCPGRHTALAVAASGLAMERVAIVPPGTLKPAASRPVRQPGPLRILSVATVTPRKGHRLLVEALAGLQDLDWRLDCIGSLERDPATTATLRQQIGSLQLGARIHLHGEQSAAQLAEAYRQADLFALPSFHEGYGMVFAEALAHGLPIVATRAGAIPDTVPDTAALLVPPGDVPALRAALRQLLADNQTRGQLADGAVAAATALPDWPLAVDRWAAALARVST